MPHDSKVSSIRLVFADEGTFHTEMIQVPVERIDQYERLIDLLREDPSVTRHLHVDLKRLVSAYLVGSDERV